jgi:hypothetical protein
MSIQNAYRLLLGFFPVVSESGAVDPAIIDEKYKSLEFSQNSLITFDSSITAYNRDPTTVESRDVKLVTDMDMWTRRETASVTAGNITLSTERKVDQSSPLATLLANLSVDNPLLGVFKVGEFLSVSGGVRTYQTVLTQPAFLTSCDAFQGAAHEIITSDWQFTSTGKPTEGSVANAQTMELTVDTGAISWSNV